MSEKIRYVIDTSAFLGGIILPLDQECIVAPSVIEEIKKGKPRADLELIIDNLKVYNPARKYLNLVTDAAKNTGDFKKLSTTDLDLIALALEHNATIISDDYAIQNVALHVGVNYLNFSSMKIKSKITWTYRCSGCLRYYQKYYKECPVCGKSLKRVRYTSQIIR